jgi:hypothetical protein
MLLTATGFVQWEDPCSVFVSAGAAPPTRCGMIQRSLHIWISMILTRKIRSSNKLMLDSPSHKLITPPMSLANWKGWKVKYYIVKVLLFKYLGFYAESQDVSFKILLITCFGFFFMGDSHDVAIYVTIARLRSLMTVFLLGSSVTHKEARNDPNRLDIYFIMLSRNVWASKEFTFG